MEHHHIDPLKVRSVNDKNICSVAVASVDLLVQPPGLDADEFSPFDVWDPTPDTLSDEEKGRILREAVNIPDPQVREEVVQVLLKNIDIFREKRLDGRCLNNFKWTLSLADGVEPRLRESHHNTYVSPNQRDLMLTKLEELVQAKETCGD